MIYNPHEYQKYCISRCITDDKLGLFLDMGLRLTKRQDSYNFNSNKRFKIQSLCNKKSISYSTKEGSRRYMDKRTRKMGTSEKFKSYFSFRLFKKKSNCLKYTS